ncbi:flagellar motor protein MotB [Swingsia samuiensis]|uniref:Chemotaxis protein MotB n=1 Tax=Swingsia samuiensis TaxID=1293412 RepID=A0A4Y6UFC2_9PROT|nr:flagellar motor protein MotB [Swingsia samuiensis]QDH16243.1 chemotaxis protein MotB [Swingsia samuiensis]
MAKNVEKNIRPIIIKRIEVIEGGHHGGSWKIAYADFVTAMMAFFLVMWLINATTDEQRKGIANFFNPLGMQSTAPSTESNIIPSKFYPISSSHHLPGIQTQPTKEEQSEQVIKNGRKEDLNHRIIVLHKGDQIQIKTQAQVQKEEFSNSVEQIQKAINVLPELKDVKNQINIHVEKDGLHLEITDSEQVPMFALGDSHPTQHAIHLLQVVAPYLQKLSGDLTISGYTDASPYKEGGLSNWSLSSARAVAARDILVQSGFSDHRIKAINGYADRHLFNPQNPMDPKNRRIILVLSSL